MEIRETSLWVSFNALTFSMNIAGAQFYNFIVPLFFSDFFVSSDLTLCNTDIIIFLFNNLKM